MIIAYYDAQNLPNLSYLPLPHMYKIMKNLYKAIFLKHIANNDHSNSS